MNYLLFVAMWIVGGIIAAFTIVPILIIFFFSIPFTINLNKTGKMRTYKPIYHNLISVILLGAIYSVVFWLINRYLSDSALYGYLFGTAIAFLFSLGKLGRNPANIADYLENNKEYMK